MEKAIEIKRRAQRCVQNGDVDGALREYEKLVATPESDPYNFVLLADLLFKKGEQSKAAERYLSAVTAYEQAGLFKNGIAVCKKMSRLSLAPALVLKHLASLHALDGLASEAAVYYAQYAEFMTRANKGEDAIDALTKAFELSQENIKLLEQLSEVYLMEGRTAEAAKAMRDAAGHYQARGQGVEAKRCEARASVIQPGAGPAQAMVGNEAGGPPVLNVPVAPQAGAPQLITPQAAALEPAASEPVAAEPPPRISLEPVVQAPEPALVEPDPRAHEVVADAPGTNGSSPANSERPEPPATGILSGSRIPGVTGTQFERLEVESGPKFSPNEFTAQPMSGLTDASAFATAAPSADMSSFEQPQSFTPPASQSEPTASEAPTPAEGVYDIGNEDASGYEQALREAQAPGAMAPKPTPFAQPPAAQVPTPSVIAQRPEEILGGVANVEGLLQRAQEEFKAGRRDSASQALVEAALAYERLERLDSAATIFRSLGRGANAPVGVMELWLANCEKRRDRTEGSQVACELGDRALNDGQQEQAQRWFEHALAIDPSNETPRRRLQRMAQPQGQVTPLVPPAPAAPAAPEVGRVAVAVGRGQAVTFDLQGLLQEFQRGVESQLEGDAQGHYDLGMAYREMGLHDEAILAFRIAERDPRLTQRSREMIGRSLADSGRHEEAVKDFERALQSQTTMDGAAEAELRYQMAMSLAAAGAMGDAMAQMEIADMRYPGKPEIQERLAEWRRAFGKAA